MWGWALVAAASAAAPDGGAVGLSWRAPVELELAAEAAPVVPTELPVVGPFRMSGVYNGVRTYEARLPVRTRSLFFDKPPDQMRVSFKGRSLSYGNDLFARGRAGTWEFSSDSLLFRVKPDAPRPAEGDVTVVYGPAEAREKALYPSSGGTVGAEFALRSAQVDDRSRHGVLLPAPSKVAWDVTIPAGAVLELSAGILPEEVLGSAASDGAELEVDVGDERVAGWRVDPSGFVPHRVDLAKWAGQTVRLRFTTSDADPALDHVFVADPRVFVPSATPRRLVYVFVDTLRRDHLGTYGYRRDASPYLDDWASHNVVFDDARTVAPWTLPSARAIETGRQPELFAASEKLQERLGALGWATGAWVGNIYLSQNFDMASGWGEHSVVNWPGADYEVWNARRFLADHRDEDTFLMVHFMDMHLPYKEPWIYRDLYVKTIPAGLGGAFNRNMLMRLASNNREVVRRYLVDRYDQNLHFINDQLAKLLPELDDATVVFFADHGEEFFDHGGLEHGHSLHDELLRVPLMMHIPGVAARHVPQRVSLLDLNATVLDLLGLDPPAQDGLSLTKLARGEPDPRFDGRVLGFGRTLYNGEAWGDLVGDDKYISTGGRDFLYDVGKDPDEQADRAAAGAPTTAARDALGPALGRPAHLAYRLLPSGRLGADYTVRVHVPGGILRAWPGDDPTKITSCAMVTIDPETVEFTFSSPVAFQREAFVVPNQPADVIAPQVTVSFVRDPVEATLGDQPDDGSGDALVHLRGGGRTLLVSYAYVPEPMGEAVNANDAEMKAGLQALGYLSDTPTPSASAPPPGDAASP